ncbi:uncharacterized protein LOC115362701 [Myripristis murdjan]|uniref:uncharacterized protein LOC115362701 n=1 Tax=Myripristis murdjan TaxID=586833 RepID=UPI0011760ABB|nr:uncharacterized protein LOC115362701 [Myripristis murdjan]
MPALPRDRALPTWAQRPDPRYRPVPRQRRPRAAPSSAQSGASWRPVITYTMNGYCGVDLIFNVVHHTIKVNNPILGDNLQSPESNSCANMPPPRLLRGPYKKWIQSEGRLPRSTKFNRKAKVPMINPSQSDSVVTASDPHESTEAVPMGHSDCPVVMESQSDFSESDDGMEMDSTINPNRGSAAAMDSDFDDGTETNEEMMYTGATLTQGQGLLAVMLFALRHHLTGAALSDLLGLINLLIPNLVPASKYLFKKFFGDPTLSSVYHYYCEACQNYIGKNPDDQLCSHCGTPFNTKTNAKKGNFFLSIPLKDLLKDTLENHGTDLTPKTVRHAHDNITDLMDGKMYQKMLKHGKLAEDDLTLLWNCDGVPVFNSSNYSIWPLQFTINELPCIQRKENVMVSGLWFGPEKPRMDTFLKPFVDECCDLAQNPFEWKDRQGTTHFSKVFSLVCSSDAVARPVLRNCKQFNGEYGCDWCLHPGVVMPKGRAFHSLGAAEEKARSPMERSLVLGAWRVIELAERRRSQ